MVSGATLFTGGGGVDLGMRAAGIETAWGIEYDPQIADVARANAVPVTVMDILDADPIQFESVNVLHASPPCPNFSTAKTNGGETQHDIDLARAICRFVDAMTPQVFTLENVYAYRRSRSFRLILAVLRQNGYWYSFEHLNSADYGVPQTRRRLILRAVRYRLVPPLPAPRVWRGWYASIDDLIDDLPESELAQWQMERLPDVIRSMLIANGGFRDELVTRDPNQPSFTITANTNQTGVRALLMDSANQSGAAMRTAIESAMTVETYRKSCRPRALRPTRAVLIGDQSANAGSGVQIREADKPAMTVRALSGGGSVPRAIDARSRVVSMTPRALARFQAFPDSYELPDGNGLACRVIGNAVPPLMYEKLVRQLCRE
jgi:DNA (cytosine-5)-methyltransferase 1